MRANQEQASWTPMFQSRQRRLFFFPTTMLRAAEKSRKSGTQFRAGAGHLNEVNAAMLDFLTLTARHGTRTEEAWLPDAGFLARPIALYGRR
jgi:hypothetical protein